MEHLLFGAGEAHIKIPYFGPPSKPLRDGGDFAAYPTRHGWNFSAWKGYELGPQPIDAEAWLKEYAPGKSLEQLADILQSWLFFELLGSVMDLSPTQLDEFLRRDEEGRPFITTRSLPKYLRKWHLSLYEDKVNLTLCERSLRERTFSDITLASQYTYGLLCFIWRGLVANGRIGEHLDPLCTVYFSVSLLVEALNTAIAVSTEDWLVPTKSFDAVYYILKPVMEKQFHWCPYLTDHLLGLGLEAATFALSLGTVRAEENLHNKCSASFCDASRAPDKGRHTSGCGGCEEVLSPMEQVVEILKKKPQEIPVITLSKEQNNGGFTLKAHSRTVGQYTAISHVWVDGLGHPKENKIFSCQLKRLASGLKHLQHEIYGETSGDSLPFWLDTLCIPNKCDHKDLKEFSITQMRSIYCDARDVLVLDADLQCLSASAPDSEVLMRLLMSSWSRRLWTYQEAAFAQRLLILGKDNCVLDINQILRSSGRQYTNPCQFFMDKRLLKASHALLRGEWKKQEDMDGTHVESNRALASEMEDWNGTLNLQKLTEKKKAFPSIAVQNILLALAQRATSRHGDETICIASSLGLDTSKLFGVDEKFAEERMKILLTSLPFIPTNILFGMGPRLPYKGFHWAPSNLVRSCAPKDLVQPNAVFRSLSCLVPDDVTPPVPPRPIKLLNSEFVTLPRPWPVTWLHPDNLGLVAYLASACFTATNLPSRLPSFFRLTISSDSTFSFRASFPPGLQIPSIHHPVIVLGESLSNKDPVPVMPSVAAVLLELTGDVKDELLMAHYGVSLTLERMSPEEADTMTGIPLFRTKLAPASWWLID